MAPAPRVISDKASMRSWSRSMRAQGKLIGLVPTMGFLHAGHLSLVAQARQLSIYVNPGTRAIVEQYESWVRVEKLELGLCGKSRPVFFRGVATVVTKLFNIVEPDVAVFGKKDYQQWRLIQRMVRDLDFSIKVIGAEITRDNDGLAMSSRNVHLSPEEREKALSINKSLLRAKSAAGDGQVHCEKLTNLVIQSVTDAGGRIDYAEIVDQNNLEKVEQIKSPVVFCVAAWFGKVRLIDNMEINLSMNV
ncbi:Pantoate--beta-alanine ligase [Glycine soja]|uniref:Pantoate--beta-alanine ligase n=1 Tax=Glycine soja TaxID=3848 RepID=A0A0B2RVW6_GLYSO|nr:Pantoate--beta-alanine ligase [Glycine soja]